MERKLEVLLVCAALAIATGPVAAQKQNQGAPAAGANDAQLAMSEGEVRKLDKSAMKITLRHGEIANIGMPPMTMVFQAKDAALLNKVREGDKVRFRVEQQGGAYILTAIEPAK